MPRLGSGEIEFQGCFLNPAIAICLCSHKPLHVPSRDAILAYLVKHGVDLESDFSLVLDANNNEDVLLVFGNHKTLKTFQLLVTTLARRHEMDCEMADDHYGPCSSSVGEQPTRAVLEGLRENQQYPLATPRPWLREVHNARGDEARIVIVSRDAKFETGHYVVCADEMQIRREQAIIDYGLIVEAVNSYETLNANVDLISRAAAMDAELQEVRTVLEGVIRVADRKTVEFERAHQLYERLRIK